MGSAALAARLFLAVVFIAAGVGKLLDPAGSRRALVDFGVSERLADFGARALPVAELAIVAGLLLQPTATWGAAAALVALVAFIAGIVRALARGEAPDCHCFGRLHSAPAGRNQLIRNVVLAAVAGFVIVAGPGALRDTGVTANTSSEAVALALAAAMLSLLVISLDVWRDRARLRRELEGVRRIADATPPGLAVGALAPSFSVRGATGETITLDDLRSRGKPIALVFGAPGCGPCSALTPELPRWREVLSESVTLGFVGIDTYVRYEDAAARAGLTAREVYESNPDLAAEADELNVVLASFRLRATPAAVLVSPEGTIASATVDGRPAVTALIRLAAAGRGAAGAFAAPRHSALASIT